MPIGYDLNELIKERWSLEMRLPEPPGVLLPSIRPEGTQTIKMSRKDLCTLLDSLLTGVTVDEAWYLKTYPDVHTAVKNGHFADPTTHYRRVGFLEGRLPSEPEVDEDFYLTRYPDVRSAISRGRFRDAREHFIKRGYREGRTARASDVRFSEREISASTFLRPPLGR